MLEQLNENCLELPRYDLGLEVFIRCSPACSRAMIQSYRHILSGGARFSRTVAFSYLTIERPI